MKDLQTIDYRVEPEVAWIVLDRPDNLNAIDLTMAEELVKCLKAVSDERQIRAVVITGAGRAFCAGGDIKLMVSMVQDPDARYTFERALRVLNSAIIAIRNLPKPVLAAINGPAFGAGFNLALACDLRIASQGATFCESFVKIGLIPDAGGTFFLSRYVGLGLASELIFTGDVIDAERAERLGLVNRVVPNEQLEPAARELVERIAVAPTQAILRAKTLLNQGLVGALESQLAYELQAQTICSQTDDFREGVRAFVEKRGAQFKGR